MKKNILLYIKYIIRIIYTLSLILFLLIKRAIIIIDCIPAPAQIIIIGASAVFGKEFKIVYDPACSTGEFLSDYKNSFPKSHTIGHDLSQEMIDYAKDYVDESFCCNAFDSPLKDNSVDLMFLRFLNSEVVNTQMAYKIFKVFFRC